VQLLKEEEKNFELPVKAGYERITSPIPNLLELLPFGEVIS